MEEHAQFPDALQGPVEETGGGDSGLGECGGGGGGGGEGGLLSGGEVVERPNIVTRVTGKGNRRGEGGEGDGGGGKGDGGGGLGEGAAYRSTESHCGGQATPRAEGRAFELR